MAAQVNQICDCNTEIIMVPFDIEDQTVVSALKRPPHVSWCRAHTIPSVQVLKNVIDGKR